MRNILIFILNTKLYYSISRHKSTQTMWNTLQDLYKGTEDIKDSTINMLTNEYELFGMEPGETMKYTQTRFLHLINKLDNLGKSFYNKDCADKNLRFMCMEWQPKVTTFKESNDLNNLDIIKLFGNLTEHENKLK